MEALFKQYFWIVKGLGLSITAALAASVITTYVGSSYIYGEAADDTGTGTDTDTDTDGEEEDDDEDKPVSASTFGAGSASPTGRGGADKTKIVASILGHNLFCPTCTKVTAPEPGSPLAAAAFTGTDELGAVTGGPQPGEVPSTLPLRLVATMESSDPKFSWATLRDEEAGGAGPYWPGDRSTSGRACRLGRAPHDPRAQRQPARVHRARRRAAEGPPKPVVDPNAKKTDEEPQVGRRDRGRRDAIKCESENSAPSSARGSRACSPTQRRWPSRPA
jgi:hypothetical protein